MRLTAWDPDVSDLFAEWDGEEPVVTRVATGFQFTEGPIWVPSGPGGPYLLFSDIPANTIYRWRPGAHATIWRRPSGPSNGITLDRHGRLLVCEDHRRRVTRAEIAGRGEYGDEPIVLASHYDGRRLNSPNDIVTRSDGAVYFTDPTYGLGRGREEQSARRVYLIPADVADGTTASAPAQPIAIAEGFSQPNGLAFSTDERRLYVDDSEQCNLRVFDVASDGTLSGGVVLCSLDRSMGKGNPDGLKVDARGNLWVTAPGGLWILAADGRPRGHLAFPEVTANLNWAETDRRTLYVAASASIYRLRLQVAGATV